jgi:hypothetical protein
MNLQPLAEAAYDAGYADFDTGYGPDKANVVAKVLSEFTDLELAERQRNPPARDMTLRDRFAIEAMPICAVFFDTNDDVVKSAAKWCYAMADAMLAERGSR